MGICGSSGNNNNNNNNNNNVVNRNQNIPNQNINVNANNNNNINVRENSFYNIDSVENINKKYEYLYKLIDNEFQGEGILKTNKYSSFVNDNELKIKREEFWETNTKGNVQIWNSLKLLFETKDIENFYVILLDLGVNFVDNSCQICYDLLGNSYLIPVFIINDPTSYDINDGKNLNFKEKKINIELKNIYDKVSKEFDSKIWIKDIIEFCNNHFKVDTSKYQLKLVYKGIIFELNDKLGNYIDKDDEVIQIFNLELI